MGKYTVGNLKDFLNPSNPDAIVLESVRQLYPDLRDCPDNVICTELLSVIRKLETPAVSAEAIFKSRNKISELPEFESKHIYKRRKLGDAKDDGEVFTLVTKLGRIVSLANSDEQAVFSGFTAKHVIEDKDTYKAVDGSKASLASLNVNVVRVMNDAKEVVSVQYPDTQRNRGFGTVHLKGDDLLERVTSDITFMTTNQYATAMLTAVKDLGFEKELNELMITWWNYYKNGTGKAPKFIECFKEKTGHLKSIIAPRNSDIKLCISMKEYSEEYVVGINFINDMILYILKCIAIRKGITDPIASSRFVSKQLDNIEFFTGFNTTHYGDYDKNYQNNVLKITP